MATEVSKSSALIVTTWVFLLLASGLPRILLQEIFDYQVSASLGTAISATVVLLGLLLTFVWNAARGLRTFFVLFLVLV